MAIVRLVPAARHIALSVGDAGSPCAGKHITATVGSYGPGNGTIVAMSGMLLGRAALRLA